MSNDLWVALGAGDRSRRTASEDDGLKESCANCGTKVAKFDKTCKKCGYLFPSVPKMKLMSEAAQVTDDMQDDIDKVALLLGAAGSDFRASDWYDAWGVAMGWAFAINDRIHDLGGQTNHTWRPAMSGPDEEAYEYQTLVELDIPVHQLENAERALNALLDKMVAAGMDY